MTSLPTPCGHCFQGSSPRLATYTATPESHSRTELLPVLVRNEKFGLSLAISAKLAKKEGTTPCAFCGTICKFAAQSEFVGDLLRPFNVLAAAGAFIGAYFLFDSPLRWFFIRDSYTIPWVENMQIFLSALYPRLLTRWSNDGQEDEDEYGGGDFDPKFRLHLSKCQ